MKYEKPKAVAFSSALKVIESGNGQKPMSVHADTFNPQDPRPTNQAYEADE